MTAPRTASLFPASIVRYQTAIAIGTLIAVVLLGYAPAYPAGYIWDDPDYVLNNQTLRSLHGLWQIWTSPASLPQWYPLVHTTFWLEYHLWGTNPLGFHIDNIFLHAAGTVLLWRLLCRLDVPGAWLAAAIFAVHPVHVESVAWITERKNTLSALLYFATAITYLRWDSDRSHRGWYFASLAFFIAALFSKTVVCSLPAAILLVRWWKVGRINQRDWLPLVPMFVVGAVLAGVTAWLERHQVHAVGPSWTFASTPVGELIARTLIAGRALWFYAGKIAFPWSLAFMYSRWHISLASPWQYVFPLAVAALIASLWLLRHRLGRAPLTAVLYFAITLFPALGYFNIYPMRYSFVADHFQHLASIGLTTLAAVGLARLIARSPRAGVTLSAAILLTLMSLTAYQCTIYENAETLWRDTLSKTPDSWMVYTNLGNTLAAEGHPLDAVPYQEAALRLAPELEDTHENFAVARMLQGRYDDGEREFNHALAINPQFVPALTDLGKLELFDRHRLSEAEQYFLRALAVSPTYAPANYAYGELLEREGKLPEAAEKYRLATEAAPDDFDSEYDLGSVLLRLKRADEAIGPLRMATQLQPRNPHAWLNLRQAYLMTNQPEAAKEIAQQALRSLSPPPRD